MNVIRHDDDVANVKPLIVEMSDRTHGFVGDFRVAKYAIPKSFIELLKEQRDEVPLK